MLTLKSFGVTAVLTVSIVLPATAAAQGQDLRNPDRQVPTVQQAAPGPPQRRPPRARGARAGPGPAQRRPPRAGTGEIAVVDVPAVTAIELPAEGFDWGDAGIGAAGGVAVLVMLVGLTLAATHRRRDSRIPA